MHTWGGGVEYGGAYGFNVATWPGRKAIIQPAVCESCLAGSGSCWLILRRR